MSKQEDIRDKKLRRNLLINIFQRLIGEWNTKGGYGYYQERTLAKYAIEVEELFDQNPEREVINGQGLSQNIH